MLMTTEILMRWWTELNDMALIACTSRSGYTWTEGDERESKNRQCSECMWPTNASEFSFGCVRTSSVVHAIMNDEWTIAAVGRSATLLFRPSKLMLHSFVSIEILHVLLSLSLYIYMSPYSTEMSIGYNERMGRTSLAATDTPPIIYI
jgi:hypothetical protein